MLLEGSVTTRKMRTYLRITYESVDGVCDFGGRVELSES